MKKQKGIILEESFWQLLHIDYQGQIFSQPAHKEAINSKGSSTKIYFHKKYISIYPTAY